MNAQSTTLTTHERAWLANPKQYGEDLEWLLEECYAAGRLTRNVLYVQGKPSPNTTLSHVDIMWNVFDPKQAHNNLPMKIFPDYYGIGT